MRDVLRSDPNFVFAHMSRILKTMIAAINDPKGLPLPDNPRVKSNIWGAMQLATIVKDGSMVLPSVGETYFFSVWQLLGDISKMDVGPHDVPIALVASSLLTLWTPQLSSRLVLYETAIPVCMQLLLCKNDSVRVSSTNLLQTMGRVRPELLRAHLTTLSSRICDGFVASLPAMVELYKIQPMSKDLFAEHLDWLVELFEKHADQRALLATTFASMAQKQVSAPVMQPFLCLSLHLPFPLPLSTAHRVRCICCAAVALDQRQSVRRSHRRHDGQRCRRPPRNVPTAAQRRQVSPGLDAGARQPAHVFNARYRCVIPCRSVDNSSRPHSSGGGAAPRSLRHHLLRPLAHVEKEHHRRDRRARVHLPRRRNAAVSSHPPVRPKPPSRRIFLTHFV